MADSSFFDALGSLGLGRTDGAVVCALAIERPAKTMANDARKRFEIIEFMCGLVEVDDGDNLDQLNQYFFSNT
jgi:hypothetical protein